MPWNMKLNQASRIMYFSISGEVDDADLDSAAERFTKLCSNNEIDENWIQILDASEITDLRELSTEKVMALAQNPAFPHRSERVFVAPSDMSFALARIYKQVFGDESNEHIHIVKSEEEMIRLLCMKHRLPNA